MMLPMICLLRDCSVSSQGPPLMYTGHASPCPKQLLFHFFNSTSTSKPPVWDTFKLDWPNEFENKCVSLIHSWLFCGLAKKSGNVALGERLCFYSLFVVLRHVIILGRNDDSCQALRLVSGCIFSQR